MLIKNKITLMLTAPFMAASAFATDEIQNAEVDAVTIAIPVQMPEISDIEEFDMMVEEVLAAEQSSIIQVSDRQDVEASGEVDMGKVEGRKRPDRKERKEGEGKERKLASEKADTDEQGADKKKRKCKKSKKGARGEVAEGAEKANRDGRSLSKKGKGSELCGFKEENIFKAIGVTTAQFEEMESIKAENKRERTDRDFFEKMDEIALSEEFQHDYAAQVIDEISEQKKQAMLEYLELRHATLSVLSAEQKETYATLKRAIKSDCHR
ncbi:exported hypothetical protein [Vibrio chagasii]|nr:exported hypothetical protein [Vibrio chagasii]